MAYISAEDVRLIRKTLKDRFKNTKFSVKKEYNSSIRVTVLSAPAAFAVEADGTTCKNCTINQYHLDDPKFNYQHINVLKEIFHIIKTASPSNQWYDKSDPMTDYHHTAFFINLHQGQWNKPFQIVEPKKKRRYIKHKAS
jgi:hypothetical protein